MLWYQEHCLKISGLYDANYAHGMHLKFMRHLHNYIKWPNAQHCSKVCPFYGLSKFWGTLWFFPLVNLLELVQLSIGFMLVNIELWKFSFGRTMALTELIIGSLVYCITSVLYHQLLWLSSFVRGITSDNKLMNLCEIGLFHIVWGVSKGTRDNYHESWWK